MYVCLVAVICLQVLYPDDSLIRSKCERQTFGEIGSQQRIRISCGQHPGGYRTGADCYLRSQEVDYPAMFRLDFKRVDCFRTPAMNTADDADLLSQQIFERLSM